MILLSPYILLGLLLGILPIAIHLLVRRPTRRIDFPSLKFLRETKKFRLSFHRIQQPLLLALRLGTLLLLVLGLSRPIATFMGQGKAEVRVIILDASLSMNAQGRAEAAKEEAAKIIRSQASNARVAIITSDEVTLATFSYDQKLLLSAIEGFKPGFRGINYQDLLQRADDMISREVSSDAKGNIYLISDFQQSGLTQSFDTAFPIKLLPIGKDVDTNSYIRDIRSGKQIQNIELNLTEIVEATGGAQAISRTLLLATPEGVVNKVEWKTEQKSICGQAGVSASDAFKEDNTRYFCFEQSNINERRRILLVDSKADSAVYFRAALDSAKSGLSDGFDLVSRASLTEVIDQLPDYKLIIWSVRGAPQAEEIEALRRYYEDGGAIWFSLSADLNLNGWNEFLKNEEAHWLPFKTLSRLTTDEDKMARLRIEITDRAAPPFRAISEGALNSVASIVMKSGYVLGVSEAASPLARWSNHEVAAVMAQNKNGFVLVLGVSPESGMGHLGRSGVFPALVDSIIKSGLNASNSSHNFIIGAPIDTRLLINSNLLPHQIDIIGINSNRQEPRRTTTAAMLLSNPGSIIRSPGIYLLSAGDKKVWIAINSPVSESSRSLALTDSLKNIFRVSSEKDNSKGLTEISEEKNGLWLYCLFAAFLLLIGEMLLRKVYS